LNDFANNLSHDEFTKFAKKTLAEITVNRAGGENTMKFSYELNGIGWAEVYFEINNKQYYFMPSYLTEALTDLIRAVEVLMPECVEEDEVRSESTFRWNSEPCENVWLLTRISEETLNIQIKEYVDGVEVGNPQTLLNEKCSFDIFIGELVHSLDNILSKHGLVGYRRQWYSGEFPLSGYIMLKHYITHRKKVDVQIINPGEHNMYYQTSLFEETETIKNATK